MSFVCPNNKNVALTGFMQSEKVYCHCYFCVYNLLVITELQIGYKFRANSNRYCKLQNKYTFNLL